jgi:predicted TIM-barrel fold metal-dependent hydrolase
LQIPGESGEIVEFWLIDGKLKGHRFPIFTEAQMETKSKQVGRKFADSKDAREMGDIDLRLKHMDDSGIDVQVLHNTLFIEHITDRSAVEVALCKSWNCWLAEIWRQGKGRLRWSCMAPTLSMPDALDQIRYAQQNGACAVLMRPVEGNRLCVDPYFYPIYEEANRLDLAIAVHVANGSSWLNDLCDQPLRTAATFHRFRPPTVAAFHDVILSELHQMFPRLRWGFIEASSQWLPWVLNEAKSRFKGIGREWPDNATREFGMFVSCDNSDDVSYIVQHCGEDCLIIGTDYGHFDTSSDVDAIKIFKERTDIVPNVKDKILSDNARALYGL